MIEQQIRKFQGMASALCLQWKFDEGDGYMVHDVSGHGNDLSITQPPKWEVRDRLRHKGKNKLYTAQEVRSP